jgi:hypothetical protein
MVRTCANCLGAKIHRFFSKRSAPHSPNKPVYSEAERHDAKEHDEQYGCLAKSRPCNVNGESWERRENGKPEERPGGAD